MRTACAIDRKDGWRRVNLGDVAEFVMGQAPPGSASNFQGKGTVFVKAGEFGASFPTIREWTTKPLRFARPGDVLICVVGATAGKLNLGIDCAIGRSVAAIRPSKEILDRFLYLQLQPKVSELRAASMGSAQGVINKQMLANIEVVIPPIDEQREIVAEIEKQFTRLETGVAGLRRVQANLKRYRAAVLKAACEGKLVPTEAELARQEGRPYETGAQLLEHILTERRQKWSGKGKYKEPEQPDTANLPQLPEGWHWTVLDQLQTLLRNGISKKPDAEAGLPILRISAVRPMSVNVSETRYLAAQVKNYAEFFLCEGDLLFTRYNGNPDLVGVCGVVPMLSFPIVHPDKLIRCKLASVEAIPKFIGIMANVGASREFLAKRVRTTAGQSGISGGDLKSLPIPIAPLTEQRRIVAEVEHRLSVVDELEGIVNTSRHRGTRLRQSILQRAFEGKLQE